MIFSVRSLFALCHHAVKVVTVDLFKFFFEKLLFKLAKEKRMGEKEVIKVSVMILD